VIDVIDVIDADRAAGEMPAARSRAVLTSAVLTS